MSAIEDREENPHVGFRITREQKDAVDYLAAVHKVSVAEYLRQRCNPEGIVEEARRIQELAAT